MIIHALRVRNFKGIRTVDLDNLGPGLVVITGKNGEGKSSVLDAIEQGLRGGKAICEEPIRRGANRAEIDIDLGDLRCVRVIEQGKTPRLKIDAKDGKPITGQRALDMLFNTRTLDPTEFSRLKPAEQATELQKALGLNLDEIDKAIAEAYETRRDAVRDADLAVKRVTGMEWHNDAPETEIQAAELTRELITLRGLEAVLRDNEELVRNSAAELNRLDQQIVEKQRQIAELQRQVAELEHLVALTNESWKEAEDEIPKVVARLAEMRTAEEIQADIDTISERNRKFHANEAYKEADLLASELTAIAKEAEDHLQALRAGRLQKIANANCPIEGLEIAEDGIRLGGVPLAQCSQAENLRVGFEVARLLNPEIRVVCCREASDFDDSAIRDLERMALENDMQLWLEMVRPHDADALEIYDGELSN